MTSLLAPCPAAKPTFSPITAKDVARARMFGLRLPSAPLAEAPPAAGRRGWGEPDVVLTDDQAAQLAAAANPRDEWESWTDAHTWELGPEALAFVTPSDEESPTPTWNAEADRYEPEGIEAAWWAGFQLGQEGEYPAPPKTMAERDRYFFQCGRLAGFMESEDGRAYLADMEACRDRAFAEFDSYRDSEPRETDGYPAGYCS